MQEAKLSIIEKAGSSEEQKSSEIFINFFIKLAIYSCQEKEEKDIMQRSLYMLKKTLFIWPQVKLKFDQIRNIINKLMNQEHQQQQ